MKKIVKNKLYLNIKVIICICAIVCSSFVYAHSGRTDSNGGHRDNNNVSGLGSYHYHCGGHPAHLHNGGVCPYNTTNTYSTTTTRSIPQKVYASEVVVSNVPQSMKVGEKNKIDANVSPSNAEDKTIYYSSSNTSVATVSSLGEINAVGVGTTIISAYTNRGTMKQFEVRIDAIKAEKVTIDTTLSNVIAGTTVIVKANVYPENTTNKKVKWRIEDENIATVTENGSLYGKSEGETILYAEIDGITAEKKVIVNEIHAKQIDIKNPDSKDVISVGDTITLQAVVIPYNTTNKKVDWYVDNESVASIDENGKLTALRMGIVTVKAYTENELCKEYTIYIYSKVFICLSSCGLICLITLIWVFKKDKRLK